MDNVKATPITVEFDAASHSLLAIKKALYRISDVATAEIALTGNTICCRLFPLSSKDSSTHDLVNRLRREVLDQDLREQIAAESKPYRDIILGYVFSKTGLQNDEQVS